jgi:hypothetical protein
MVQRSDDHGQRPDTANGGGGAVYANSVALSNFRVSNSNFSSSSVTSACGATGVPNPATRSEA